MRTKHLIYFLSLAETHSTRQTSRDLYTTHQNVSKTIRQLEADFNTTLFFRSQKGVELTAAGKLMLPVAQRAHDDFARLRTDIAALEKRPDLTGELHILGSTLASSTLLSSLIQTFSELYPALSIRLDNDEPTAILRKIALHPQMLGVVVILSSPEFRDLYTPYIEQVTLMPLLQDTYYCTVSSQSPLAELKSISLDQFVQYPFAAIASGEDGGSILADLIIQRGGKVAFSSNNHQTVLRALRSGRYVSISSGLTHQQNLENEAKDDRLRLIPFREDMTFTISLATHLRPQLTEVNQAFADFIRSRHL